MRPISPTLFALLLAMVSGGCLLADTDQPPQLPGLDPSPCVLDQRAYLIDSIEIPQSPARVNEIGFDLDHDVYGRPDNAGASAISFLMDQFSSAAQLSESVQSALDEQRVVWIVDVQACVESADPYTAISLRRGEASGDGYRFVDGDSVAAIGYRTNSGMVAFDGVAPVPVTTFADVLGTHPTGWMRGNGFAIELADDDGGATGRIGVAVEDGYLDMIAGPLAAYFESRLDAGTSDYAVDLDADADGEITAAELLDDDLAGAMLGPDLDMMAYFSGELVFWPNHDEEQESLSLGIGFHAVPASVVR